MVPLFWLGMVLPFDVRSVLGLGAFVSLAVAVLTLAVPGQEQPGPPWVCPEPLQKLGVQWAQLLSGREENSASLAGEAVNKVFLARSGCPGSAAWLLVTPQHPWVHILATHEQSSVFG